MLPTGSPVHLQTEAAREERDLTLDGMDSLNAVKETVFLSCFY